MSYMLENYMKSKVYGESFEAVIEECKARKFKYPAIYKNLDNEFFAVANISFPCTTEVMADYLSKDSEYVIVYHEKLGRNITFMP